jgi:uncharacterized repeat protein (TIGR03806 family)
MHQTMLQPTKSKMFCSTKRILIVAVIMLIFQAVISRAANFVMSGTDGVGTSSFNSGLNWTGGAAPAAGNTYQTESFLLRTPANSTSLVFAGDSLEIQTGGDLRDKTSATITVNNLILDNGGIFDMSGNGGSLAGSITLSGGMAYISVGGGESFACNAIISGSGGFCTSSPVSNGAGTIIITSANTFTGTVNVNGGTLVLGVGSSLASTNIIVASGATLDVSATNFTLGGNQRLSGSGAVTGSVCTVSGSQIYAGLNGTSGTNTFNNNLTFDPGASCYFDLSSTAGGTNDLIILNGAGSVLKCGGASIGINCGATLDQANDYLLFNLTGGSASIVSNFNIAPVWTGTTPANASGYAIVTEGNNVMLHYNTGITNLPVVTNGVASAITPASATLNGQVLSSVGQVPMVNVHYGTSDGGTNPAAWTTNVSLGLQNGSFAAAVSNLTANTTYYFASSASNSAGVAWATPSQSFTTPVTVVTNLAATSVQTSSAVLNGAVVSTVSPIPAVILYYGLTDGATNPAAWTTNIYLGQQGGNFAATVTGLSPNTTYYYAVVATNASGTAWAQPSLTFTTLASVFPATITDLGTAAPIPGPFDISQLSISGQAGSPDGLNYYTDNQVIRATGEPGQTFTTVSVSPGYLLNSIAIKTGGGTTYGTESPQGYVLHIYSVSNSTATLIDTYNATNFAFADGDWMQWSGLNVLLSSNAVYAYSFGKASSAVGGWEAMGDASGNPYPGGQIGMMPVAGGTITFGGSHNYDAVFDVGLSATGSQPVAVLTNSPATGVMSASATLNGMVLTTGNSLPQVTIYYGTSDGGTNAGAWSNNVAIPGTQSGAFLAMISGLGENTTYFFTAQASNSAGISWASPSQSFTTPAPVSPVVTNLPASNVQGSSAILNGDVVSTGYQIPTVNLYYGQTDGGTNAATWANNIYLGQQGGSFAATITGLSTNTTYYYAVSATNIGGTVWAQPSLTFTTLPTAPLASVLTYHNDNSRTGANTNETLLTPGTVNTNNFGRLTTYVVDGFVFAQPLYVANVAIPGQGTHNVVFLATENNSVYAFDADVNLGTNGGLLWHTNLGIAPLSYNHEFGDRYNGGYYTDLTPEVGITGTPVIDPISGTIYVDVLTREITTTTNYYHRIHALNITNGMEQPYSPVVVSASVPGTGVGGNGTVVTFNAQQHNQRPALTLAGGNLYVAYGSFADTDPYHGWVMGFNATNLVQLTNYIFNTTPNATTAVFGQNAGEGALWMGGDGLCADSSNNLYFETANGSFSANTNGGDYGDSFVKLSTTNQLAVSDYFTPYNQAAMASGDNDLGSGGPLLLPDSVGSINHPHLILGGGKAGIIFLVDRDNMGKYNGPSGADMDVQEIATGMFFFSTPAYFNYMIYYQGKGSVMSAFTITNGYIVPTPVSSSLTSFAGYGTTPSISANGTNNGIVWTIQTDGSTPSDNGAAVLHAYNATNLTLELYNSSQLLSRDNPGGGVKYTVPTIANGKVYVGAQYALSVYGLTTFVATPTITPNGESFTNSVTVTLSDATPGTAIYYTLDGTVPTSSSTLYTAPFAITSTLNVQAIAVKSGAVNSGVASASFVNTAQAGNGIGLLGQYWTNTTGVAFTNISFSTPATLVRTDAVVNFNWSTNGPDPSIGQTNFTASWTGSVQAQYNETYTFMVVADDGVRLWVNGQLLVDDWNTHSSLTTNSGSITLNAQQLYNIQLDYFQGNSNAVVQLLWSSPSTAQAIIPQTQLYPYTNPPPTVVMASPADGSTYTASASVTVSANADAPYNPVGTVSFYANGSLLGTLSNSVDAPLYEMTVPGLAAGSYALTAVATDGSGLSSTSAPVNITVNAGSGLPYGLTNTLPVSAFLNMPTTFNGTLPALLSQTGAFSDTTNRIPAGGLIPYQPNTPLWSDGAVKSRFMALPNNGGTLTPDQQISFLPTNSWTFPAGTVFVKNFDLIVDQTNTNTPLRRLETRLLVRDINGAVYGVTYKWRPDNSDAELLSSSLSENILITNATGVSTQTWYYPSPADCLTCHTPVANYVLGVNTRQLNGNLTYPSTGNTDNQLRTLNRLGLFNPAFDESSITNFEKLSALTNLTASLEERARSYLDANCAQCHQPGGAGITFDARYDTPLSRQNITNFPAAFSLGVDNACIIKAQDVWRSVLLSRINTNASAIKMPPLARSVIDTNAVQFFNDWINSLPGTPALAPPTITPSGGTFVASVNVSLQASDTNATIYYTLDGTLPTTNSLLYSGAFNLTGNETVTANAFETNFYNSIGASAQFLVQPLNFTSEGFLPGQQFQLGFAGVTGSNYVLQASTNLINWTPISTNNATTNFFNLLDPDATNFQERFYRVLQQ